MARIDRVLQFLVCPQRDFIGRLDDGRLPSNRLHVGSFATTRLRGTGLAGAPDPYVDTVRTLVDPERPGSDRVRLILDEDWHPNRCDEFAVFGRHCVKGSDGARLVGALEDLRWRPQTRVIRANSINVGSSPRTREIIEEALGGARIEHTRVGVFGVWTHIKVEYLLLHLSTMAPVFPHIAVCGPLCASPNEDDHRTALKKFRALGFEVFDDIPSYLDWLGVAQDALALRAARQGTRAWKAGA